jgi:heme oxygenase
MATGRPRIVERLREETRALHAELERTAAVLEGGRARYVWFVERQYGFFAGIEPRVLSAAAPGALGLDLEPRRRAHLFAADLLHLGLHPARLPRCAALPELGSPARALGALYALEGSTLAGAFLLAQLGRSLGIAPGEGASGIAPYGGALFEMWRGYMTAVERFVAERPDAEAEIVAAARETFEAMIAWLREPAEARAAQA